MNRNIGLTADIRVLSQQVLLYLRKMYIHTNIF